MEDLIPQVKEIIHPYEIEFDITIPLIAGGGIHTSEDVESILNSGADGVQMGIVLIKSLL